MRELLVYRFSLPPEYPDHTKDKKGDKAHEDGNSPLGGSGLVKKITKHKFFFNGSTPPNFPLSLSETDVREESPPL